MEFSVIKRNTITNDIEDVLIVTKDENIANDIAATNCAKKAKDVIFEVKPNKNKRSEIELNY